MTYFAKFRSCEISCIFIANLKLVNLTIFCLLITLQKSFFMELFLVLLCLIHTVFGFTSRTVKIGCNFNYFNCFNIETDDQIVEGPMFLPAAYNYSVDAVGAQYIAAFIMAIKFVSTCSIVAKIKIILFL